MVPAYVKLIIRKHKYSNSGLFYIENLIKDLKIVIKNSEKANSNFSLGWLIRRFFVEQRVSDADIFGR